MRTLTQPGVFKMTESVVVYSDKRSGEAGSDLESERDWMRVADECGRTAAEIAELGARRVRIDPDGTADRVLDPAEVVEAVVAGRQVVEARDAGEADVVE